MKKPVVAVTMGDPAGIGPEIVGGALGEADVRESCNPVVVGDPAIMVQALELLGSRLSIKVVSTTANVGEDPSVLYIVPAGVLHNKEVVPGKLDARYGQSAAACCYKAARIAEAGEINAIVSTPFNKEAFHMAGYLAMDDLAYFEECFGGDTHACVVGEVAGLWVTMVTYHVPFREIADLITKDSVIERIRNLHKVMKAAHVGSLRIGVSGLNVHSGEGGMFWNEEIDEIKPAIQSAINEGYDVVGPVPPDSLFVKALDGDYSGLVCMYHDQANIARKILGRKQPGVTLYTGMLIPVLTVPHGTAYDIAWKGIARHSMLTRAIKMAATMSHG